MPVIAAYTKVYSSEETYVALLQLHFTVPWQFIEVMPAHIVILFSSVASSNMPDRWRVSVLTLYSFIGLALCIIALHNIHKDNEVTRTTRIHSEEYLTYIQRVSWELERESSIFITSVDNVSFVSLTSTLVNQNENYSTALSSFLRRIYTLHTHETDLHLLVNKQIGNSN